MTNKATKKESVKTIVKNATKDRVFETVNSGKNYWKPANGEIIEGTFERMERTEGAKFGIIEKDANGKKIKVSYNAVINTDDGEVNLPSSKVLNDFFQGDDELLKPLKKGHYVRITATGKKLKKGKKEGEDNSTFNTYILEKEKI